MLSPCIGLAIKGGEGGEVSLNLKVKVMEWHRVGIQYPGQCGKAKWMAWCNTDLSDFFGWICFTFKSAWTFVCAFRLSSKTFPCIFFGCCLHFVSEKNEDKISKSAQWPQQRGTRAPQPKYTGDCFNIHWNKARKFRHFWRKKFHLKKSLRSVLHQAIQMMRP